MNELLSAKGSGLKRCIILPDKNAFLSPGRRQTVSLFENNHRVALKLGCAINLLKLVSAVGELEAANESLDNCITCCA